MSEGMKGKVLLEGKAEKFLETTAVGTRFQFMREGYFIKAKGDNVYHSIVPLKDSFKM